MTVGVNLAALNLKQTDHDTISVIADGDRIKCFQSPTLTTRHPGRDEGLNFSNDKVFILRLKNLEQPCLVIQHLNHVYESTVELLFHAYVVPVNIQSSRNAMPMGESLPKHTWYTLNVFDFGSEHFLSQSEIVAWAMRRLKKRKDSFEPCRFFMAGPYQYINGVPGFKKEAVLK